MSIAWKIIILSLLVSFSLLAQVTARLGGTVLDPSGSTVSEARISVTNQNTNAHLETSTRPDGAFLFPALEPGTYSINIQARGFAGKVLERYELTVAEQAEQVIHLELAGAKSSIEVKAGEESARVQTADAQVSRVITMQEIEALPLAGRNPLELAYYQPGIVYNGQLSMANGTRIPSTNTVVDGIEAADPVYPSMGLSQVSTNTDAIEEIRIVTSGGKAEYGRNSGAQIELLTRSGSNHWSGNLFEYLRNTDLDANNFFNNLTGLPRPVLIRNIFGASLGGPIRRNRTFFFANYQGTRTRSQSPLDSTVLTDTASRGIFRWRSPGSSQINSFDIVANDPRHLGIDPAVAKYLALLPPSNYPGRGDGLNTSGFRFNSPNNSVADQGTLKIDHNLTDSHHFYFRYNRAQFEADDSGNGALASFPNQQTGTQSGPSTGFSAGSDWSVTPRIVNSLRVGLTSYDVTFNRPQRGGGSVLTGLLFTSPVSAAFSTGRSVPLLDISDTLTWVRGKHTMKAGFRAQPSTDSEWTDNGTGSNVSLNPALTSSIGPNAASVISIADRTTFIQLYNNLLGRIFSTQQTFYSNDLINYLPADSAKFRKRHYHDAAVFFQDDWRVNRRLTLNYGLRWEYMGLPQLDGAAFEHLDQESLVNGVTPVDNFRLLPGSGAAKSYKRGFAPRLGLAWDPFGDGKTAIRAAWGIYYDRIQSGDFSSSDGNPGVSAISADFRNLQAGSDDRIADGIPAVPPPASVNLALPGFFFTYSPHLRLPYDQQMNFTVQREIARRTTLDVAYVGGRGVQLQSLADYAEPHLSADFLQAFREIQAYQASGVQPSPANLFVRLFGTPAAALSAMNGTFVRAGAAGRVASTLNLTNTSLTPAGLPDWYLAPYPQFSRLAVIGNDGRSYYNSLQISLRRSIGSLRMSANYTWSKNIDNLPLSDVTSTCSYQDLRDVRGLADTNVPQNFTTTATYSLPFGRGKGFAAHLPGPVNAILGNWDVGIINQVQSGFAFSVTSGYMTSDSFSPAGNRADLSTAGPLGQIVRSGNGVSYFTPQQAALFSIPTPGSHGTAARNMFRGPMFWNTNASLVRRFQLTGRAWLRLRAEAFNLLNRTNFLGVDANLASPTFGRITGAIFPRVLQVALRLDF